jgi:cell division protein FtsZ
MITFEPKQQPAYIKVIGVGGGGSNAVNHMFTQGIKGVDFVVCNTDVQALESSPVPIKIVLGNRILGAGAKPEVGRSAATESIEDIREIFTDETKMVFITAGMGGGTGTGAAPIIAEIAREKNILTVAIVTLPFLWEGRRRRQQAELGIEEIRKHVDTLLVICNDKLREQYGNLSVKEAFAHADDVLSSAAKGIAELITVPGYVNIDFEDVKTVIENSGKAIMGSATAEGEGRALTAIENAMSSPLLNDNEIKGAQNILLYIMTGTEDITMDEITEITDYVHQESGGDHEADVIWGNGVDENLEKKIGITIIATGFDPKKKVHVQEKKIVVGGIGNAEVKNKEQDVEKEEQKEVKPRPEFKSVLHKEETPEIKKPSKPEIKITGNTGKNETDKPKETYKPYDAVKPAESIELVNPLKKEAEKKIIHTLNDDETKPEPNREGITFFGKESQPHLSIQRTVYTKSTAPDTSKEAQGIEQKDEAIDRNSHIRSQRLKEMSMFKKEQFDEIENVPAYIRRKIELDDSTPSTDSNVSRYMLGKDSKNNPDIKSDNSFLHDNID